MGEQRGLDDRPRVACGCGRRRRRAGARRRRSSRASRREVQPQSLPSTIPRVTAARPSASISAPGRSGRRLSSDLGLRQPAAAGEHDRGAERQVDEEDEAPVGELDQGAAEGRADRRRRGRRGAPEADPGGAALGREAVEDDRQRGRGDHRRGDALDDAEGDQQRQRGGRRAEQAGGGEAGDAEQEDAAVAEAVGEPAGRDQQRGDDDEVAVEHPGEGVPPRAREGGGDVGEGDVDDRRVEEGDEGAGAGDRHGRFYVHCHTSRPRLDYVRGHIETRRRSSRSNRKRRDGRERLLERRPPAARREGLRRDGAARRGRARQGAARLDLPPLPRRQGAARGRGGGSWRGVEIREAIERSLAERGLTETLAMFGDDVPPPRQGPPGAARLPGRRRRPRPPRGPGAGRRRDRRLPELGSADRGGAARGGRRPRRTPRPSPASSSRRSRAPWSAPAPPATRRRSTPRSGSARRSTRCSPQLTRRVEGPLRGIAGGRPSPAATLPE